MTLLRTIRRTRTRSRGQTAIEYAMILAAIVLPLAAALRTMVEDSDGNDNMVRKMVSVAYGDEKSLGVIGRPYP